MKAILLRLAFGASVCLVWLCLVPFDARADAPVETSPPSSQLLVQLNHANLDTTPVAVPEPSAKALQHYRSSLGFAGVAILWNLFLPVLVLVTGFSARLRAWATRWGQNSQPAACGRKRRGAPLPAAVQTLHPRLAGAIRGGVIFLPTP